MSCRIDHITVAARSLEEGIAWMAERLGAAMPPGGTHPRMGTRNHLLRLGPRLFLELIAIDPDLPPPVRPRWFGLDDPAMARCLSERPRLVAWVAETADIRAMALPELGEVASMSRGDFDWLITIPADGLPPMGGAAPVLIQWHGPKHPADRMADFGVGLDRLDLRHPEPDQLRSLLRRLGLDTEPKLGISEGPAGLSAALSTPWGKVILD